MSPGKVIKRIFTVFIIVFFAFIIIRIIMLDDKSTLKDIYPTENFKESYSQNGDGAFSYHKMNSKISYDGYYSAYGMVYDENTGEVQLTVKYNDSLTEKYLAGAVKEDFRWELTDENGEVISTAKEVGEAEKYQYNYVRLVFENVSFGKTVNLRLACDKLEYPKEKSEVNFIVHTEGEKFKAYKLSGEEKAQLDKD